MPSPAERAERSQSVIEVRNRACVVGSVPGRARTMNVPRPAAIETDGLGKRYGRRWALHDCSLTIPDGKVVGLVGPNGAGKTTPLHLVVGLAPIRIDGRPMIRLAWLQARTQTFVTVAGVAALAVLLALTGSNLTHLYNTMIAPCAANGDCPPTTVNAFLNNNSGLRNALDLLVLFVPALIGIFWGAPMVACELESGTFRLAWKQSVSRTRWLAIKLCVTLAITMAVAGLLSLMVTWWADSFDRVRADAFTYFEQRDIAHRVRRVRLRARRRGGCADPPHAAGHGRRAGRVSPLRGWP